MKLVDSLMEQELLENLIEGTKPPFPPECRNLDWLLATPFRYEPPYPVGSRFRRAGRTPGVFYASEEIDTAVAELAFGRLLFFAESPATPWPSNPAGYTAFSVLYATARSIDLAAPPFDGAARLWTHPTDYVPCQAFADTARAAGVEVIRYTSVRHPRQGCNLALLTPLAFAATEPQDRQTWRIHPGAHGVMAVAEFPSRRLAFTRDDFPDPRLADMRWKR
jgi:hypothetical protein